MNIRLLACVAVVLGAAPALAGDLELLQVGQSNWAGVNQYNRANTVDIVQQGTNTNGNNYASFGQQGQSNRVRAEQYSLTDNALIVEQTGARNYVGAYQEAVGFNRFSLTQSRLSRR